MKNRAPAFLFYVRDWLADEKVCLMSLAERGAYITLLAYCWQEDSIPDDVQQLARLCSTSEEEMQTVWPMVRKRFLKSPRNGRLMNKRLKAEKTEIELRRKQCSEAGKISASKRSVISKIGNTRSTEPRFGVATKSNSSSASASASAFALKKEPPKVPLKGDADAANIKKLIATYAQRIFDRHKKKRGCSLTMATAKLRTACSGMSVVRVEKLLARIDSSHQAWCRSSAWTKDSGDYQKGLEPFLNPKARRWEVLPDAEETTEDPGDLPEYRDPYAEDGND